MNFLYLKALHIIFVVTWFAGLFYIVRIFVYHSEAAGKTEPERSILMNHFKKAARPLWYGITWPSAILTYIFGTWMIVQVYPWPMPSWLLLKLGFILALTLYHLQCGIMFRRFQKDEIRYSGFKLRLWNEVATIILVSVVFIVVLRDTTNWLYGLVGLLIFSGLLLVAINVYKKVREKSEKS